MAGGGREKGLGCWVGPVPSQMVFTRISSPSPSVSLHPHIPSQAPEHHHELPPQAQRLRALPIAALLFGEVTFL